VTVSTPRWLAVTALGLPWFDGGLTERICAEREEEDHRADSEWTYPPSRGCAVLDELVTRPAEDLDVLAMLVSQAPVGAVVDC
jgi:hypothetical protein